MLPPCRDTGTEDELDEMSMGCEGAEWSGKVAQVKTQVRKGRFAVLGKKVKERKE